MSYRPVFGLYLLHRYYTDSVCRDFLIEPTSGTRRKLDNHRCVLKTGPNWIRGYMDSDLVPLERGEAFQFRLNLQNPSLPLFTDLQVIHNTPRPQYTNAPKHARATPSSPRLALHLQSRLTFFRERLIVDEPSSSAQYLLSREPWGSVTAEGFRVQGLEPVIQVSEYNKARRAVVLDTRSAAKGHVFTLEYPTTPSRRRDVFAEVELTVEPTGKDGDAPGLGDYQIEFEPRQARWLYYLVSAHSAPKYVLEDKNPKSELAFDARDLVREPDPSDQVATLLANQYGDMKRFRFTSNRPVECRKFPRHRLQLRTVSDLASSTILADSLPSPPLGNLTLIDPDGSKQDAVFHICRYLTGSFSSLGGPA